MTVEQLIEALQAHPPDLRVMVDGYEGGCDDLEPQGILQRDVRLNVNARWYYGHHEEAYPEDKHESPATARALLLRRPWHEDGV